MGVLAETGGDNSIPDGATIDRVPETWCEIRAGPEYLLRKYVFRNSTFHAHQYFYEDPDCSRPKYAVSAYGSYQLLRESWYVPGGTEAQYQVIKAHVIPYTQEMAAMLNSHFKTGCVDLSFEDLKPFRKQLFMSIPPDDSNEEDDDDDAKKELPFVDDIDCSMMLNFSLSELQLVRTEIRRHYKHHHVSQYNQPKKNKHIKVVKELLLGNVHTSRRQRQRHRPSAYQTPLKMAETEGCGVCSRVANSNDYYPPELRTHHGSIMTLQGEWVSTRCESRQRGMFLTRWLSFLSDEKSWQGRYDYYQDPLCTESSFTLFAKGSYAGGKASSLIPNAKDYSFKVTRLKITPKDIRVTDHLNYYSGGECGKAKTWKLGVEQDVTFTNGCVTLGIQLPNIEQEVLKMEVVHRKLHLYVGERFTDEPVRRFRDKRPTSFQEPLVKCDSVSMGMHINSVYGGQALPLRAGEFRSSSLAASVSSAWVVLLVCVCFELFLVR
ncbi:protein APCDD1-like [Gigantopelta aegis]|uniref:protein APCDD1-like n=1 Tax=Gigantopelta aegis TaxID=1735272 RepID=UPI001B889FF1|nr:protein APCDD1-like [Gigantopelta aegis]